MTTAALEAWWQGKLAEVDPTLATNGIDAVWWSFAVGRSGIVQDATDLDQAIKIILATPYGSDPHRPDFASNIWLYIDYPVPRATPHVVRESMLAVETWEPRVELESVSVNPYRPNQAALTINAQWTIGSVEGQTEVAIG
ncbi:GPW/gp25 family protein [Pseudanabaena sp. FACHB-2040]|nr:GPW/gp25 family protein [Pseudanabaena sp. FACHB-2040]MBD2261350.1 GPW/gp25 family protein [Pseudanabaena sp. FACHB-2040]